MLKCVNKKRGYLNFRVYLSKSKCKELVWIESHRSFAAVMHGLLVM